MQPLNVRFSPEQIAWLDTLRGGPLVSRSQALRQVVADAMARDPRRFHALERRMADGPAS